MITVVPFTVFLTVGIVLAVRDGRRRRLAAHLAGHEVLFNSLSFLVSDALQLDERTAAKVRRRVAKGQFRAAGDVLRKKEPSNAPFDYPLQALSGLMQVRSGNLDEALAHFKDAAKGLSIRLAHVEVSIAEVYVAKGALSDATEMATTSVERVRQLKREAHSFPRYWIPWVELVKVYLLRRNSKEADLTTYDMAANVRREDRSRAIELIDRSSSSFKMNKVTAVLDVLEGTRKVEQVATQLHKQPATVSKWVGDAKKVMTKDQLHALMNTRPSR